MYFETRILADVQDHAHALDGWQQEYHQLTPGRFESRLTQARGRDFHLFREHINHRVVQRGAAPAEVSSVAMPLEPLTATFQGQRVNGLALMTLPGGTAFEFHAPASAHVVAISLPASELEELVELCAGTSGLRRLRQSVIPLGNNCTTVRTAQRLRLCLDHAQDCDAGFWSHAAAEKALRDDVIAIMLSMVESLSDAPARDLTHRTYVDIVRRSARLLDDNGDTPISVVDLCRHLRISRRTLQTSFQRVAQMSPVSYLRASRLNRVRQLLRATSAEAMSISDAATQWGFTHHSHFAREYRKLFGELPSATSRRR